MRVLLLILILTFTSVSAVADPPAINSPAEPPPAGAAQVFTLWPSGAPSAVGSTESDTPKLYWFPALGPGPHSAVVVMPGGGFTGLSVAHEGTEPALWLNLHGVSAAVLIYRLAPRYRFPAPMLDGARAVRLLRDSSAELKILPNSIGVWGFSAGGQLAGYLATASPSDPALADPANTRNTASHPDFAILSYGRLSLAATIPRENNMGALLGGHITPENLDRISPIKHVTPQASPTFLFSTTSDNVVDSENSADFYVALRRANVPAELHIFELGPHGSGLGQGYPKAAELTAWPNLLAAWMRQNQWMPPA